MLVPTQLLPSALGLKWGLSPAECVESLAVTPITQVPGHLQFALDLGDDLRNVHLFFEEPGNRGANAWYDARGNRYDGAQGAMWDSQGYLVRITGNWDPERSGLFRIQTTLFESQTLFDKDKPEQDADIFETRSRVHSEYRRKFAQLVELYSNTLGPPDFSGSRTILVETEPTTSWEENPTYPIGQLEGSLAYWSTPEGRLQVGMHQEDKELAITISLASYRTE